MEKVFISTSEKNTGDLARVCAKMTKRGDVWALEGTLGAGKSVFARAFIQEITAADEVPSPTFTLVQSYSSLKGFDVYHYDLYRCFIFNLCYNINIFVFIFLLRVYCPAY